MRDVHRNDVCAKILEARQHFPEDLAHLRIEVGQRFQVGLRHPDPETGGAAFEERHVVSRARGSGIVSSATGGECLEQQSVVVHCSRHGADVVQRPGRREGARAADQIVSRFQADHVAVGGRTADGSPSVAAERAHAKTRRK